jgi:hypothetical protein
LMLISCFSLAFSFLPMKRLLNMACILEGRRGWRRGRFSGAPRTLRKALPSLRGRGASGLRRRRGLCHGAGPFADRLRRKGSAFHAKAECSCDCPLFGSFARPPQAVVTSTLK